MLIKVTEKEINFDGGISQKLNKNKEVVIFPSPNHCEAKDLEIKDFPNSIDYTTLFPNDSILIIDKKTNTIKFFRDWPGNIQVYYFYSKESKELIICDNISELVKYKKTIKASEYGLNLFISQRKYLHSKTIYEGVFMLHPGLYIDLEQTGFDFSIKAWYSPFKEISVNNFKDAKSKYLNAIDNSISRLAPKDIPVAIMFSGGSDSVFLLERMIKLGYKDIELYCLCVKGQEIQFKYAKENALEYGYDVNPIMVNSNDLYADWKELFRYCYNYLSDLRIDGLFAPTLKLFNELKSKYKNKNVTLVWGSQYSLISPVITTKAILFKIYPVFLLIKLGNVFKFLSGLTNYLSLKLIRSHMLHKEFMGENSQLAFKKLYEDSFRKINHPDQLINLFLSTDYNHLKHWWMDWRNKVSEKFLPNGKNVYPFHDRALQESSMPISLSVRIGGPLKVLKMPHSYKKFFYELFDNIELKKISRGNYTALPEWFSLFANETFYNNLIGDIKKPQNNDLVEFLCSHNNIIIPNSYSEFIKLNTLEIEKISAILYLITRLNEDKINFKKAILK